MNMHLLSGGRRMVSRMSQLKQAGARPQLCPHAPPAKRCAAAQTAWLTVHDLRHRLGASRRASHHPSSDADRCPSLVCRWGKPRPGISLLVEACFAESCYIERSRRHRALNALLLCCLHMPIALAMVSTAGRCLFGSPHAARPQGFYVKDASTLLSVRELAPQVYCDAARTLGPGWTRSACQAHLPLFVRATSARLPGPPFAPIDASDPSPNPHVDPSAPVAEHPAPLVLDCFHSDAPPCLSLASGYSTCAPPPAASRFSWRRCGVPGRALLFPPPAACLSLEPACAMRSVGNSQTPQDE